MKTRNDILDEVLDLNRQQQSLQETIDKLYIEAQGIIDEQDDKDDSGYSIIDNIKSYVINHHL